MRIAVGTDIVRIEKIGPLMSSGRLARILRPEEISRSTHDHIAGRIALKEAAIKAFGLTADDWLAVRISQTGPKPIVELLDTPDDLLSVDCSISHDGDYAFATVVGLYA